MAARRVVCDEIPDAGYPIENFIPSPDGSTPVPTMDDNRWEALMNEERPFNTNMPRDTIPQALQELMSETLAIDDYNGKLHYFWAYMFFYHWHFNEEERCKIFEKIKPRGYRSPEWIQAPESLRGWFDDTYDKFTKWIWERVKLYGEMYLKSEEGEYWLWKFNKASEKSRSKSEPKIMNGILFGILELQEVFSPLLEICERTKSRLGCGYWISESDNGNWWAERLKQKFIQAVAIYVVGEAGNPGSQTDRPMTKTLRKCSPLPPPRPGIRHPAKNPGQMNWLSMDRPFNKLEAFDPIGLGENEHCSTPENGEYTSTLPSEVLDEGTRGELRSTSPHKAALCINSTLPEESSAADVQSSGTITAPLQPEDLPKTARRFIACKDPEGKTRMRRMLQGKATKSLFSQIPRQNPEEMFVQTPEEEAGDSPLSETRVIWRMDTPEGTRIFRVRDEGEAEEVADNLSGEESQYSEDLTEIDSYEYGAEAKARALHERQRERNMKVARDGEGFEKHKSRGNDQSKGKEKAREPGEWFPNSAGRNRGQQKKSLDQRGELPREGRAVEQVEATYNSAGGSWFPARSGPSHLPKEGRAKGQAEAPSNLAGEGWFPVRSGPSHLPKEGRAKEQVEGTSSLSGEGWFPARSGPSHLPKEGRAKEQVEAICSSTGERCIPAQPGPSHVIPRGQQAIERGKFTHDRRSAVRTMYNQRPLFNPDIDPYTAIDPAHKNQEKSKHYKS